MRATQSLPSSAPTRVGLPRWGILVVLILGQAALALAMQRLPVLGLAHAAGTVILGLYAIGRRNAALLTCVCGYLVGCEVLWRQVRAPIFYQMAPYTLIALSTLGVVLFTGRLNRHGRMAMLYAALLLPSVVATIRVAGAGSRELVAFALSGPIALATFVAFISQMTANRDVFRRILWTVLISGVAPLTIAVSNIRSTLAQAGEIRFSRQSNFITSGGFGPVQVSAVLGLGVLVGVLLTMLERERMVRVIAGGVAFAFAVQSLLTFSRGGMSATLIAVSGLAIMQAGNKKVRRRIIAVLCVAIVLGYYLVIPWLTDFTGGAFEERFTDTSSGRTELAANDLRIFGENPIFGVGPGMTKYQRLTYDLCQMRSDRCGEEASSHTEFTRLLSEHGVPGIAAMAVLIVLAVQALWRGNKLNPFAAAFIFWSVAQMFYANLRVVAVPFAFGLAFLTIKSDPPPEEAALAAPAA